MLSIQGVARNNEGQSLSDGDYEFVFRLYETLSGGAAVWSETKTLSVLNGVFSHNLGEIASMSQLDFNNHYWLSIEIGGNGELSPRTKLTLSPYAVMSQLDGTSNVFPQDGNVGIGTTSPTAQLSLGVWNSGSAGTTDDVQLRLNGTHNMGVNNGGKKLMIEGYDNDGSEVYPIYVQDENSSADFWIKNKPSGTGRSTAYFQGNVGIGKSTPKKQLTINSSVNTAALSIGGYLSDGHWTGIQMGYGAEDADTYHKVGIFYQRVAGNALGSLIFATDNTSDDSNVDIDDARMTITSAGKVGIGTTSPARHLHIMLPNVANNDNAYGIRLQLNNDDAGSDWWDIGIDNQAGDEDLIFKFSGSGLAWIEPSDGAYGHSSDKRLKKNIQPMSNMLGNVLKLKPVFYHMKTQTNSDPLKMGFIAQEVQEIFPNSNIVADQNGNLGLYYEDFGVLAIKAIQEQQVMIDKQQQEIDDLKSRLEKLESLIKNK
jgi:hypothetical protein